MIKIKRLNAALPVAFLFSTTCTLADDIGISYLGSLTLAKVETSVDSGIYHSDRSYVLTKEGRNVISVRAVQYLPGDIVDFYRNVLNGKISFCLYGTKSNCYNVPKREQEAIRLTLADMDNMQGEN
ncbi:hypothetical protein [Vibrio owensii]|uniref:Lipoprotein n=1 Tax=Vibrio owensii CAIM 1854 = LMG 25443 TaxID=1229493 RepID=A0A0C1W9U3_9VIBR|nr:hypothetical protein [Vibrio owensii]KIF53107.1 hypothetical protein H735_09185 [Vibrio owensii CAIM 1854 = LMG 25443]